VTAATWEWWSAVQMVADALGELLVGVIVAAGALLLVGVGSWWVWRSATRRVARWRTLWRRGVLRLRAASSPWAPRGELAALRWTLLENLEQTERLVSGGALAAAIPRSLPALLPQLRHLAAELDAQLNLWDHEPDPAMLRQALPILRDRVQGVVAAATRMRATALDLADEAGRPSREAAEADLRQGLEGLEAGLEAIRRLHMPPFGAGLAPPVDPAPRSAVANSRRR
jgi:hypothetical protein